MKLLCGAMLALFAGTAFGQVTDFHLSRQTPSGSLSVIGDAAEDQGSWLLKLTTGTGRQCRGNISQYETGCHRLTCPGRSRP